MKPHTVAYFETDPERNWAELLGGVRLLTVLTIMDHAGLLKWSGRANDLYSDGKWKLTNEGIRIVAIHSSNYDTQVAARKLL